MTEPDDDFDNWLATLQARATDKDPMAEALRTAVQNEHDEIKAQLELEADLAARRFMERLRKERSLQGDKRGRYAWVLGTLSTAAILVFGISVVMQSGRSGAPPVVVETMRGFTGTVKISSEHQAASAENLMASLKEMGLQPTQETGADGIEIRVEVTATELPRFGPWFNSKGGRAVAPGTYRVLVQGVEK